MAQRQHDPRPFFTVIAWPEGEDRDQVAERLEAATGVPFADLRLRLGHAAPRILGQVDPVIAELGCRAIVEAGGDAFAPTLADLTALGPSLKIKDLRLDEGRIALDLWRGPSCHIERSAVQILIRAKIRSTDVKHDRAPVLPPHVFGGGSMRLAAGITYAARGLAATYGAGYVANCGDELAGITRTRRTSDKLDIHTVDGHVFQIDGDKFGFGVLGDLRAHGDSGNMDRMCELLCHLAPDEIVDPYFGIWKAPTGHDRLRLPGQLVNADDPAFAFYSRWAALLYRHVIG